MVPRLTRSDCERRRQRHARSLCHAAHVPFRTIVPFGIARGIRLQLSLTANRYPIRAATSVQSTTVVASLRHEAPMSPLGLASQRGAGTGIQLQMALVAKREQSRLSTLSFDSVFQNDKELDDLLLDWDLRDVLVGGIASEVPIHAER